MPSMPTTTIPSHVDPALYSKASEFGTSSEQSDDDWEYEYEENETKSFYVTISLPTSAIPSLKLKSRQDAARAYSRAKAGPAEASESALPHVSGEHRQTAPNASHISDKFQLVDLHTTEPLLSYQKHTYTCSWESPIGTELLFTTTESAESASLPVDRTTSTYAMLDRPSAARLVCKSVQLVPIGLQQGAKANPKPNRTDTGGNQTKIASSGAPDTTGTSVRIPIGPSVQAPRIQQAAFLERLILAKRAKGEKDEVTVYARRVNTGTGWRTQGVLAKAAEDFANTRFMLPLSSDPTTVVQGDDITENADEVLANDFAPGTNQTRNDTQASTSSVGGRPTGRKRRANVSAEDLEDTARNPTSVPVPKKRGRPRRVVSQKLFSDDWSGSHNGVVDERGNRSDIFNGVGGHEDLVMSGGRGDDGEIIDDGHESNSGVA